MAIEDDINFFEKVPTLSMLGRGALRILAIGAESRYVHSGETLFSVGDDADGGYVVQEGSFRLSPRGGDTAKSIRVGVGTLLGELALFTETPRPCSAFRGRCFSRCSRAIRTPRSACAKFSPSARTIPNATCSVCAP